MSGFSATGVFTSIGANALAAGPNGTTNPTLQVDASTVGAATGAKFKSAAAGGGMAISVVSPNANESLSIDAKGTGQVFIGYNSSGGTIFGGAVQTTTTLDVGTALAVNGSAFVVLSSGKTTIADTTSSTNRSTGALVVGNGSSGGIATGGQVSAANFAAFGSPASVSALDNSGIPATTVANGANQVLAAGTAARITVVDLASGQWATYQGYGGIVFSLLLASSGQFVAPTTSPGGSTMSVAWNGSSFAFYNNVGASHSYRFIIDRWV